MPTSRVPSPRQGGQTARSQARALCALLAAMLMVAAFPSRASADTLTWTGGGDGISFNQAANWSPSKVPDSGDDCTIGAGAAAVQVLGNPSVRSLTLARALNITNCWQLTVGVELALQSGGLVSIENPCATRSLVFSSGPASVTGTGTIVIKGAGQNGEAISVRDGASLTIAPGITILFGPVATGSGAQIRVEAGSTLVNNGLILCQQAGQTLSISGAGTFINSATVRATAGTVRFEVANWHNNSAIEASNASLVFAGSWGSGGTVSLNQSTWTLDGVYENFGNVQRIGGAIFLKTVPTSALIVANTSTGDLTVGIGPIIGKTFQTFGGTKFIADGVTLTSCTIAGVVYTSATITITGGLTMQPGGRLFAGTVICSGAPQTLNGSGEFDITKLAVQSPLVIESGVTVKSSSLVIDSAATLTNLSTIVGNDSLTISGGGQLVNEDWVGTTSVAPLTITVASLLNHGTLQSNGGCTVGDLVNWSNTHVTKLLGATTLSGQFANSGEILQTGGTFLLKRNWSNDGIIKLVNTAATFDGVYSTLGAVQRTGGSLTLKGVFTGPQLDATSSVGQLTLGDLSLVNCEVRSTVGSTFLVTGNVSLQSCTLHANISMLPCSTLLVSGDLTLADNAQVVINRGPATCPAFAVQFAPGVQQILGSGEFRLLQGANCFRALAGSNVTLTLGITIRIPSTSAATTANLQIDSTASLTNQGSIVVEKAACTFLSSGGTFQNQGTLAALAGTLHVSNLSGPLNALSVLAGAVAKISGNPYTVDVSPTLAPGASLELSGTYTINAPIAATDATLSLAGTWTNNSSISALRSVVAFGGAMTNNQDITVTESSLSLSAISAGSGSMVVTDSTAAVNGVPIPAATFINTAIAFSGALSDGQTLQADASTGDISLANSSFTSATLRSRDGKRFATASGHAITLTNCTIDGELAVTNCGTVSVNGALILENNATIRLNNACPQGLIFTGLTISGSGEIIADGASTSESQIISTSGAITASPGITLRIPPSASGGGTSRVLFSSSAGRWINQGAIVNHAPGRDLVFTGTGRFASSGLVEADGAPIRITSTFIENFSGNRITGGTWRSLNAPIDFGNRAINQISAGTEIELVGAASTLSHFQKLDTNSGTLRIRDKALSIGPASVFSNTGLLDLASDATLAVTGRMVFTSTSTFRTQFAGLEPSEIGRITATTGCTLNGKLQGSFVSSYIPVAGDESASLISAPSFSGAFTSSCVDANPFGLGVQPVSATPQSLALVVTPASGVFPVLLESPTDASATPNASFHAAAAPLNAALQWKKNDAPLTDGPTGSGSVISGSTSQTLTILNAQPSDVGDYTITLTNSCGSLTSNPATLRLCTGDLNSDGLVDDADFVIFLAAYNTLDCADPAMPANCPADFNQDAVVDDADFLLFIPAYDALLCP